MPKESVIHQGFSHWLKSEGIPFLHNRTDKKSHMTKGDPDYCLTLAQRCCFIEIKVPGNKLSPDQEQRIAYLRSKGNKVVVVYSLEEAITAVQDFFGVIRGAITNECKTQKALNVTSTNLPVPVLAE